MRYEKRAPCADCGEFEPSIVTVVISYPRSFADAAGYTLDELRKAEDSLGYATILSHGVIGSCLNDFPKTFFILRGAGFDGSVSIEDGINGFDEIRQPTEFLLPFIHGSRG